MIMQFSLASSVRVMIVLMLAGSCHGDVLAVAPPGPCGFGTLSPTDSPPASLVHALEEAQGRPELIEGIGQLQAWFQTCDAGAARSSVRSFRQAVDRDPGDTVARLLLGIALARGPEVQVPGAAGYLHRLTHHFSNSEREARRLLLGVARDASSGTAALELTALALATRDVQSLKDAATSLRAVLRHADNAELSAALAEVLLATGDLKGARQAASEAVERGSRLGGRALAIARLRSGDRSDAAARLYFAPLDSADSGTLEFYLEDLAPLLTKEQFSAWHQLSEPERANWIRQEWEWRASTSAVNLGERLAEHQHRLAVASRQYQRTANRGPRPDEALSLPLAYVAAPFDDRGLVFIRHGAPVETIRAPFGGTGMIREAWVYLGLGGRPALFEFVKPSGYGDYVLAAPLPCDPFVFMFGEGGQRGEVLFEAWARGGGRSSSSLTRSAPRPPGAAQAVPDPPAEWRRHFEAVYLDYATSLGRYDPSLGARGLRCLAVARGLEQTGAASVRGTIAEITFLNVLNRLDESVALKRVEDALLTESGPAVFTKPLRVLLTLYEFLRNGTPELVAVAGIPGSDVVASADGADFRYALRFTFALENDSSRTVERLDTTLAFQSSRRLLDGDLVRLAVAMPYHAAGGRTARITIGDVNDGSRGQILAGRKTLGIASARMALSDLVIAETRHGSWVRGNERIAAIPGHQVLAGSTFRLFHELYGAQDGDPIRVQVDVTPGRGAGLLAPIGGLLSRRYAISLAFDDVVTTDADGVARVSRELATELRAGMYTLQLTVQNRDTGETVMRNTDLLVLEPAR